MDADQERRAGLPIRRNLGLIYALSFIIAILMAATPVTGMLYCSVACPTDDLMQPFVANYVVKLFIGLPMLLGSVPSPETKGR